MPHSTTWSSREELRREGVSMYAVYADAPNNWLCTLGMDFPRAFEKRKEENFVMVKTRGIEERGEEVE